MPTTDRLARSVLSLFVASSCAAACASRTTTSEGPSEGPSQGAPPLPALGGVARIQSDAQALASLATAPLSRAFLAATARLEGIMPYEVFRSADKKRAFTAAEAAALAPAERAALVPFPVDEDTYFTTRYGSPLSYLRPLEVLAAHGATLAPGSKLLDFGYGYVTHLRLLASLGVDATGVDVEPVLRAMYASPSDQGAVAGDGLTGHVRLIDGAFPKDPAIVAAVGVGYHVILSKNVLKKGYLHPDRPADPKLLIDLGVPDVAVLGAFFRALAPGGLMLVYNISPALTPADKPFVPWSDGRSPYPRAAWESAGFEVLAIDVDDTDSARTMARILGWGDDPDEPWDLDHDLSVLWTLVRRPH